MNEHIKKTFEYKVKDIDTTKGIVTIYINAFNNRDSDGDISLPGSFARTFKNNGNTLQHWLNHDRDKLIGVPLELKEDHFGAIAVSQLNIKKQLAMDVFEDYKLFAEHNKTLQHSVRVWPIKYEEEREEDEETGRTTYTRTISEWKMIMEYSTVYGWGSNQNTPLIDIKEMKDLEIMMREGNYSDEKHKAIETTYEKLKQLLANDPQGTHEDDPPALESEKIKRFINLIQI